MEKVSWHHLLVDDIYTPIWPNIAASLITSIILWLKLHAIHKHVKKNSQKDDS